MTRFSGESTVQRFPVILIAVLCSHAYEASGQATAEVIYNHYERCRNASPVGETCTLNETVRLEQGGTLRVWIKQTKLGFFNYEVRGYVAKTTAPAGQGIRTETASDPQHKPAHDSTLLELTHSARYRGYVVTIAPSTIPLPKDGADSGTVIMPGSALLIITVDSDDERFAFSGGLSLSGIRSARFVARSETGSAPFKIESENARRDDASVGFATFVTLRPFSGGWKWYWPGIGIGLEKGAATQYYFSPIGVQVSKGIFLNAGVVLGHVSTLPSGLRIGDTLTDPNRLADLPQRSKFGGFVGLSFSFLGGGKDTFGRPFAGATSP